MIRRLLSLPVALTLLSLASPASAATSTSGSITGSVATVASLVSLNVTTTNGTNNISFVGCTGGTSSYSALGFPNGQCQANSTIVLSTGTASETVTVVGSDASATDGSGATWALCDWLAFGYYFGCSGSKPGVDEYGLSLLGQAGAVHLTKPSSSDPSTSTGQLAPLTDYQETLTLFGPQSSSNSSGATYTMSVTWTAS